LKKERKEFDVVLMDLQMPVMDLKLLNTLEIQCLFDSIIALTADVTTVDLEKCKLAGMDDYLVKPVDENYCTAK
jgi:two-component system CheB/CheR fusion protein